MPYTYGLTFLPRETQSLLQANNRNNSSHDLDSTYHVPSTVTVSYVAILFIPTITYKVGTVSH